MMVLKYLTDYIEIHRDGNVPHIISHTDALEMIRTNSDEKLVSILKRMFDKPK
jgi:hypothetical protein